MDRGLGDPKCGTSIKTRIMRIGIVAPRISSAENLIMAPVRPDNLSANQPEPVSPKKN
jgi:hypothetical protein